jgi:hypothetical protein
VAVVENVLLYGFGSEGSGGREECVLKPVEELVPCMPIELAVATLAVDRPLSLVDVITMFPVPVI